MIPATIVCVLACLAVVAAEFRDARMLRNVAKPIASAAFIVVAVLAIRDGGLMLRPTPFGEAPGWFGRQMLAGYQRFILIGLVLGAIGDIALLGTSSRAFMAGLVAFLLGHAAYVVAICHRMMPDEWLDFGGIRVAIPIVAGIAALTWLWPHLGKMKVPVIFYVLTIVAMVAGAIAIVTADGLPPRNGKLLAAGAVLFFASDLAVARNRFIEKSVTNRAWGLPAYYAGQLLIAWSIS
jgi:uncharacterized membrane protein YhhN